MDKVRGWVKLEDWRHTLEVELPCLTSGSDVRSEMSVQSKVTPSFWPEKQRMAMPFIMMGKLWCVR